MTFRAKGGADYDSFVDWGARLSRELPFFRKLFAAHDVRRVLDAGCGSAKHAVAFAEEGFEVAAFDPSEEMREQAERNIREAGAEVSLLPGSFADAPCIAQQAFAGPADAVLSLGNGLPHVHGDAGLAEALGAFGEALRPGGVLVLHLLNHERLLRTRVRSVPPKVRETPDGTVAFLRVLDYVDDGIAFDFLTLTRRPGALEGDGTSAGTASAEDWQLESRRSVHTAMPIAVLRDALGEAGFEIESVLGGHDGHELDEMADESVIVVAVKR